MGVCIAKDRAISVPPEGGVAIKSAIHKSVIMDSKAKVDIHKFYRFNSVIGHGHFGTVREAYRFNNETIPFAEKSICKENIKRDIYLLKREIDILMEVDHPNIIKYYESYEDDKYIHIVMEMCNGGDLLDKASNEGVMSEDVLAPLMRKLFAAVNHLHGMYICHRDLKPENVLFTTKDLTADIKLIDFGMSAKFGEDVTTMTTMVGTPHYLAPEVLSSKYGKECDVWSLGIMVYFLLTGCYPFDGKTLNSIFQSILKAEFDFSGPEWENVSSECKDLVSKMLLVDPTLRITLLNALKHKWITSARQSKPPQEISRQALRNLKAFKPLSKLQQEAMKVIVKNLSSEEIVDLKNTFTALDTNDTGFVSAQDLETAMFRAGFNISAEDIRSKK
jgi:calcium-dependent protein kinase